MALDDPISNTNAIQTDRYVFKIEHILKSHGKAKISQPEINILLDLGIYNISKDNIVCCARHAKEDRNCYHALSARMVATGPSSISTLSQRFDWTADQTSESLQELLGNFMCSEKHKNDTRACRKLFDDWLPVVLHHQEFARNRALQPYLDQFRPREQELLFQINILNARITELMMLGEREVEQKEQVMREKDEWLELKRQMMEEGQSLHNTVQSLMEKNARLEGRC